MSTPPDKNQPENTIERTKPGKPEQLPKTNNVVLDKDSHQALLEVRAALALQSEGDQLAAMHIDGLSTPPARKSGLPEAPLTQPKTPLEGSFLLPAPTETKTINRADNKITEVQTKRTGFLSNETTTTQLAYDASGTTLTRTVDNPISSGHPELNNMVAASSGDTTFGDSTKVHVNTDRKSGYVQFPSDDGSSGSIRHYWKMTASGQPKEDRLAYVGEDGKELAKIVPGPNRSRMYIYPDRKQELHNLPKDGSLPSIASISQKADGLHESYKMGANDERKEWDFETVTKANGQKEYFVHKKDFPEVQKPGEPDSRIKLEQLPDNRQLATARANLRHLADKYISEPQKRAKFEADLLRLETRMKYGVDAEGTEQDKSTHLVKAQEQTAQTYEQIARLLDVQANKSATSIDGDQRTRLAEDVISQAGTPSSINQGHRETCQTAQAEEVRSYIRRLDQAAKLVADIALTGQFESPLPDKTTVTLDASNLTAHDQSKQENLSDGQRSFASQLFQTTAVNMEYQLKYPQVAYEDLYQGTDLTEHTVYKHFWNAPDFDRSKAFNGREVEQPNYQGGAADLKDVYEHLTGEKVAQASDICLTSDDVSTWDKPDLEKFKKTLADLKTRGKLPVSLMVNTVNEPLRTDGRFNDNRPGDGGSGGHVISVTDYDPSTGLCNIDDTWYRAGDRTGANALGAERTLSLMLSPEPALDAARRDARTEPTGKFDPYLAFDRVRLESDWGNNTEDATQLGNRLADSLLAARARNLPLDQDKFGNATDKLNDVYYHLPKSAQSAFVSRMMEKDPDRSWLQLLSGASRKSALAQAEQQAMLKEALQFNNPIY